MRQATRLCGSSQEWFSLLARYCQQVDRQLSLGALRSENDCGRGWNRGAGHFACVEVTAVVRNTAEQGLRLFQWADAWILAGRAVTFFWVRLVAGESWSHAGRVDSRADRGLTARHSTRVLGDLAPSDRGVGDAMD